MPIGGSKNIRRYLAELGPSGRGLRLGGLCDIGEARDFLRGLEWAGLGTDLDRAGMEAFGFSVCDADLEEELIRALDVEVVEAIVESEGELRSFRTLQKQPAQRDRSAARPRD